MNSQISQISEIIEDIKEKISDNEYKIIMDNLMKIHNDNNDNNNNNDNNIFERRILTTEENIARIEERERLYPQAHTSEPIIRMIMHMAEEQSNHLKSVRLRIEELNQQTNRIINQ